MLRPRRLVILGLVLIIAGVARVRFQSRASPASGRVHTITFRGARFAVVDVPLEQFEIRAVWRPGGTRLKDVPGVVRMNAGIFEPDFRPSGVLVAEGAVNFPVNAGNGSGNFYLKPNGIFAIRNGRAVIEETSAYGSAGVSVATQSGPLLLADGRIHPQLNASSSNALIRNAVGVRDGKHVVLVISLDPVNLWTMAALFRDELHCSNALYLDGVISALWAADSGLDDQLEQGPFAGVLTVQPIRP